MIQDVSAVLINLADLIFVFAFCVFPCVFPCVSLKRASTRLKNNGRSWSGIQSQSHWMLEMKSSRKGQMTISLKHKILYKGRSLDQEISNHRHADCDVNCRKNSQTSLFEYCPTFLAFVAVRIGMQ